MLEERNYDKPHVEEIQDIVEEVLMQQQLPKVAKKYISTVIIVPDGKWILN